MNDLPGLLFSGLAGLLAGALFFGGLYLTVRKGLAARRPAVLFPVSFAARTFIVLVLLYVAMDGDPAGAVPFMAGFIISRFAAGRFAASPAGIPRRREGSS